MKFSVHHSILAGFLALAGSGVASAADTNQTLTALARTANLPAKATVSEPAPLPVSTFVIPRKMVDGRDPFFPNSSRVYENGTTVATNREPSIVADLNLKGISGTQEQPLAIINTTTFTTGETNEVLIKSGRIKILCVEINMAAGTVLVQIGAERRELRLAGEK